MRWILIPIALLTAAANPAGGAEAGGVILDEGSPWRMFASWNTPVSLKDGQAEPDSGHGGYFAARTAPPPADWASPDFDDGDWSRYGLERERRREFDYGFATWGAPGPTLSVMCLRARFALDDPAAARGLRLSLEYRGGAVVYVNGKEVARGHLPAAGAAAAVPEAPAKPYPDEAFVHPERIRSSLCILSEFGQPKRFKDSLEKRIRGLKDVAVDAKLLRRGVNVLAVEIHRAPYFGMGLKKEGLNHESVWSTCGLVDVELRAEAGARPNVARPAGIQVWSSSAMHRPDPAEFADPHEGPRAVRITGCLNGSFNGKLMVSSAGPISGLRVTVGDLSRTGGEGTIPAANVTTLYTVRDDLLSMRYRTPPGGFWDSLAAEPPARLEPSEKAGACQAVTLKVRIPADAAPGDYLGKVTVSAEGLPPVELPVELRVVGWKLPDPKGFVTHMGVIQSPDSVALQYKVPLWSEEHWKLVEESFRRLGEIGNNYVVVPLVAHTNFGNAESMVRWVKSQGPGSGVQGSGTANQGTTGSEKTEPGTPNPEPYSYDFTIFDRYLDLAQKHMNVDVVCLYAWERYAGFRYWGRGDPIVHSGLKVTLRNGDAGKCHDLQGPRFADAEFRKFWEPACKEVMARLAGRGLGAATMLGISGDAHRPTKETTPHYMALFPGAKWIGNPHGDIRGSQVHGIPVGYNTVYYMNLCPPPDSGKRYHGWQAKTDYYGRSRGPTAPLALWRGSVEAALIHNCSGLGRIGADFWPVLHGTDWKSHRSKQQGKHSASVAARYPESCWDQLNLDRGTEAILCPGPKGAMPTERSEQIRQGVQECEARAFIEKAILEGKLPADLAARCQEVVDQRTWYVRGLGACGGAGGAALGGVTYNTWYEASGSAGLAGKLYSCAAEVAAKLGR